MWLQEFSVAGAGVGRGTPFSNDSCLLCANYYSRSPGIPEVPRKIVPYHLHFRLKNRSEKM